VGKPLATKPPDAQKISYTIGGCVDACVLGSEGGRVPLANGQTRGPEIRGSGSISRLFLEREGILLPVLVGTEVGGIAALREATWRPSPREGGV
jgi:hypothetical protein